MDRLVRIRRRYVSLSSNQLEPKIMSRTRFAIVAGTVLVVCSGSLAHEQTLQRARDEQRKAEQRLNDQAAVEQDQKTPGRRMPCQNWTCRRCVQSDCPGKYKSDRPRNRSGTLAAIPYRPPKSLVLLRRSCPPRAAPVAVRCRGLSRFGKQSGRNTKLIFAGKPISHFH